MQEAPKEQEASTYFLYTFERQKKKGKRTAAKEKRTAARGKELEKNRKKKDRGPCPRDPRNRPTPL